MTPKTISYGIPTFTLRGPLVHFAAFRSHIGFYPSPDGIEAFKHELRGYRTSKGAVQFPLDRPLPLDLVGRIVRHRAAVSLSRSPAGSKRKRGKA
ncbi:MAG: hypothetical protein JXA20_15650 [Spirochaetes bacterium]|nr:hypothetical protein [Spirochaetota bacterium]